jgi:hypothetical protein
VPPRERGERTSRAGALNAARHPARAADDSTHVTQAANAPRANAETTPRRPPGSTQPPHRRAAAPAAVRTVTSARSLLSSCAWEQATKVAAQSRSARTTLNCGARLGAAFRIRGRNQKSPIFRRYARNSSRAGTRSSTMAASARAGGCSVNRRGDVGGWLRASLCCRGSTRSSPLRGQCQRPGEGRRCPSSDSHPSPAAAGRQERCRTNRSAKRCVKQYATRRWRRRPVACGDRPTARHR